MPRRKKKSELEQIEELNQKLERIEVKRNRLLTHFVLGRMEVLHLNFAETKSLLEHLCRDVPDERQLEQFALLKERMAQAEPLPQDDTICELKVRVTATEKAQIQRNMALAHYQNFNAYAKKLLLDGYLIVWTSHETRELTKELGAVNRSLNQLVKRANATQSIYEGDFRDILRCWERIKNRVLRYLEEMRSKSNDIAV